MNTASVTILGITFLSHTWPLVFGLPSLLVVMGITGGLYEVFTNNNNKWSK